jgi:hypothetical protein
MIRDGCMLKILFKKGKREEGKNPYNLDSSLIMKEKKQELSFYFIFICWKFLFFKIFFILKIY